MIEEHKKVYRISLAIVLAAAVAFLFVDRTVSNSLVMGIVLYYVYLHVLTRTVTTQLEVAAGRRNMAIPGGFLLRMLVLALPLFIAAKFQQHFNILGAFAPLFINHLVTFAVYARKDSVTA